MDLSRYLGNSGTKINPNVRKMMVKNGETAQFEELSLKLLKRKVSPVNDSILDIAEVFYVSLTGKTANLCLTCQSPVPFIGFKLGYQKFCGPSCQMKNVEQQQLRKDDALKRFGVKNYRLIGASKNSMIKKSDNFKQKHSKRMKKTWAINKESILQKMRETKRRNGKKPWLTRFKQTVSTLEKQGFTIIDSLESGKPKSVQHTCGTIQPYGRWSSNNRYLCVTCNPNPRTKLESTVLDIIEETFNVSFQRQLKIGNIKVDALLGNVAIDLNGLFWHSAAAEAAGFGTYSPNYHHDRYVLCKENGIKLIQIFEDEWLNKQDIVLNRLKVILGKSKSVGARACKLIELTNFSNVKSFMNQNHLAGHVPFSKAWGLLYNDQIIAIGTFGKTRFGKRDKIELLRFCSIDNVVGGLSRIVKAASRFYQQDILSYSDCFWGDGDGYKKAGFILDSEISPGYFYYDKKNCSRVSRNAFRRDSFEKVFSIPWDPKLSEEENAKLVSCFRVDDAGKNRWLYKQLQ